MPLGNDKLLVRLYQARIGELEEAALQRVPNNFHYLMDELDLLRRLEVINKKLDVLSTVHGHTIHDQDRCSDESCDVTDDDEDSSVHPAPFPS